MIKIQNTIAFDNTTIYFNISHNIIEISLHLKEYDEKIKKKINPISIALINLTEDECWLFDINKLAQQKPQYKTLASFLNNYKKYIAYRLNRNYESVFNNIKTNHCVLCVEIKAKDILNFEDLLKACDNV